MKLKLEFEKDEIKDIKVCQFKIKVSEFEILPFGKKIRVVNSKLGVHQVKIRVREE